MKLTHLGTSSKNGGSPRLFATDRGTYVVQGYLVTDEESLAALREHGLPDHETAVEVPANLMQFLPGATA